MVKRRFRSSINIAKTRSFPGADIGSDHELVIMTFKLHLKRVKKQGQTKIKFDLEKLKDPTIAEAFEAMIGGKFAALTTLCDDDRDIDTITNTLNTAVTDTANEILGKYRTVKKPWVTNDVLDLCDKRRELKKMKSDTEGAKEYRAINQDVKKAMKKAKENWIAEQCQSIEDNLKKNNSKKAYQLVKDLTSTKKVRMSTISGTTTDKFGWLPNLLVIMLSRIALYQVISKMLQCTGTLQAIYVWHYFMFFKILFHNYIKNVTVLLSIVHYLWLDAEWWEIEIKSRCQYSLRAVVQWQQAYWGHVLYELNWTC